MDELRTVARYPSAAQAEMMRGQLQACGIESVLDSVESATLSTHGFGLASVGVLVREGDVQAAARIVAEHEAEARASAGKPRAADACLACGTPIAESAQRCAACGWTWMDETPA